MLAIKFQRIGKKHQPSYRVVVAERRSKLIAPPVDDVGSYNPTTKVAGLKKDRIVYWLNVGAKPTVSIHNLLVREGIIQKPKMAIRMRKAKQEVAAAVSTSTAQVPLKTEQGEPAHEAERAA